MTTVVSETGPQQPAPSGDANVIAGDIILGWRGASNALKMTVGGDLFLPAVTTADNGKRLQVAAGRWQAVSPDAAIDSLTEIYTGTLTVAGDGSSRADTLIAGHDWADFDDINIYWTYRMANDTGNVAKTVTNNTTVPRAFLVSSGFEVTLPAEKADMYLSVSGTNNLLVRGRQRGNSQTNPIYYPVIGRISGLVRGTV